MLIEEWGKISVDEINREIERLPAILAKCINVNGSNNFHTSLFIYIYTHINIHSSYML